MAEIILMAEIYLNGGDQLKWPRFIYMAEIKMAEIYLYGGD